MWQIAEYDASDIEGGASRCDSEGGPVGVIGEVIGSED